MDADDRDRHALGAIAAGDCRALEDLYAWHRDGMLRGELESIRSLRAALRADAAPPSVPGGVWDEIRRPPDRRRPRRAPLLLATAAAITVVVMSAGLVLWLAADDAHEAVPTSTTSIETARTIEQAAAALEAQPRVALRSTTEAMRSAHTARLEVSGTAVAAFDGAILGQPGTPLEVGVVLTATEPSTSVPARRRASPTG